MSRRQVPLTVVIPNYNHGHLIGTQLKSIFEQSVEPERVIVYDDASTDESVAAIEAAIVSRKNVEFIRKDTNSGPIALLNEGLRRANAEFICFLAADDVTLPGYFEKSVTMLEQFPAAAFCSAVTYVQHGADATTWPEWTYYPSQTPAFISPAKVRELLLAFENWMMVAVYRRSALLEVGGFDPKLRSFADGFLYRVLALRHGACFIPEILTKMNLSDAGYSMSDSRSEERSAEILVYSSTLMRTRFANLFPPDLIARNNGRMLYRLLVTKINNFQQSTRNVVATAQPVAGGWLALVIIAWVARLLRAALFLALRYRDTVQRLRLKFVRKGRTPPHVG